MTERRVEVVYCDSIYEEVRKKYILVGVYNEDLYVGVIPTILPTLCAFVNIITPAERPFGWIRARVVQGEDEMTLLDTGEVEDFPRTGLHTTASAGKPDMLSALFALTLQPYLIEAETSLRVVVETEEGIIKSRLLRIRKESLAVIA
jgi:hypothetical protein